MGVIVNRQFNVRGLSDESGNVVEHYAYTPYGKQTIMDGTGNDIGVTAQNNFYGFTGRYKDVETGLWYFRARYFSDELGRFISRDPLGYVDGMSLYAGYFAAGFGLDPSGRNLSVNSMIGIAGIYNISTPPLVFGFGLYARVQVEVVRGSCCKDGKPREYIKTMIRGEGGIYTGIPPNGFTSTLPVIQNLTTCPEEGPLVVQWGGIVRFSFAMYVGSCSLNSNGVVRCRHSVNWWSWSGPSFQGGVWVSASHVEVI